MVKHAKLWYDSMVRYACDKAIKTSDDSIPFSSPLILLRRRAGGTNKKIFVGPEPRSTWSSRGERAMAVHIASWMPTSLAC